MGCVLLRAGHNGTGYYIVRNTGTISAMPEIAVERSRVSDQVFHILSREIVSGRYPPGELLPTQRRLAADLEVNMTSVREAVKRLEQLRLVESRQGEGMRVRDWRSHCGSTCSCTSWSDPRGSTRARWARCSRRGG